MHDIDRTQGEYGWEMDGFETDQFEFMGELEAYQETQTGGPFDEAEEMELAAQLLEVTDEAELDQFLGDLIKKASRAVGKIVKSPIGRTLGGILKGAAKQALPMLGGALGTLALPGIGSVTGSQLASAAGSLFGLELEGLSPEDQEFELARQFVRFAGTAAETAAQAPPSAPPQQVANAAAITAAQQHAPGLLRGPGAATPPSIRASGGRGSSGRWVRRGRRIILYGV